MHYTVYDVYVYAVCERQREGEGVAELGARMIFSWGIEAWRMGQDQFFDKKLVKF